MRTYEEFEKSAQRARAESRRPTGCKSKNVSHGPTMRCIITEWSIVRVYRGPKMLTNRNKLMSVQVWFNSPLSWRAVRIRCKDFGRTLPSVGCSSANDKKHYSCSCDIFETITKQLLMNVVWATDAQQKTNIAPKQRVRDARWSVDSVAVGGTAMPGPLMWPVDVGDGTVVMMPRRSILPEPWSRLLLPVFLQRNFINGRGDVFARRFRIFGQNKI